MENFIVTTVVGGASAAILAFYATAFVRPKMFFFLFKPFMAIIFSLAAFDLVFMFGAEAATFAASDKVPFILEKSIDIHSAIHEGLEHDFMRPCIYIAGFACMLAILAVACIPVANHVLRDEAEKEEKAKK